MVAPRIEVIGINLHAETQTVHIELDSSGKCSCAILSIQGQRSQEQSRAYQATLLSSRNSERTDACHHVHHHLAYLESVDQPFVLLL